MKIIAAAGRERFIVEMEEDEIATSENAVKPCDLVEQLREEIIVDAFASGAISDGKLADRLIRERAIAADVIVRVSNDYAKLVKQAIEQECEIQRMRSVMSAAPAPSVRVKALVWREAWGGSDDDIVEWVADTPWGRAFASVAGHVDSAGIRYARHADVPDELRKRLQDAAQSAHEAQILSALEVGAPSTHSPADVEAEIASIVQSINEWDDRTSLDDYPDHLLITSEELADTLRNFATSIATTVGK